ncbi:MAG: aminopeptidase P family protein [Butyricicoccus sp.]|nr:aminopeptidase P family protein [Butyricicoccus sp.]
MNNIESIREKLCERGLDALLLLTEQNIRYAAGFLISDGAVLVTRQFAWMFTDSRYIEAARAHAEGVELQLHGAGRSLTGCIKAALEKSGCEKVGAEERGVPYGRWQELEKSLGCELVPAGEILGELRAVKQEYEVRSIVAAQRIAETALDEVLGIIRPGITEREIAAELTYRMMLHGGEGNSFDPICVTGAKSSMPHGVPGDAAVKAGDFVTMDFGCLKNGYCSDMTRTVAVGYADDEMKKVYDTVLRAQLAGIEAARGGVPGAEIHSAAAKVITEAGYGEYFGHGFGHSLGLDIHEKPNASPLNKNPMPAGAVISAEPGIYIPGKFGVRIEDMLYLTNEGCVNLTKAPKHLMIL